VIDAAGGRRELALFGFSEGGPMAVLFAATYPERVRALVLYGTFMRFSDEPESDRRWEQVRDVTEEWGTGRLVDIFAPSTAAGGGVQRRLLGVFERAAASPAMARALVRFCREIDISDVCPTVAVPTLVLHRRDEHMPIEQGRRLAEAIPGARFVELDGIDHIPWVGDRDALLDEMEEFLTGRRQPRRADRVLATVLFTDIVGSTDTAARLGDSEWRTLLSRHDAIVRDSIGRFDGREVKTLGDGFLAVFDGPARAVRCAAEIAEAVRPLGIEVRAGVHTGECEVTENDVAGLAVHVSARVVALAGPGEVLVSSTVKDLVLGSGLEFQPRGAATLKGVPGEWQLFALASESPVRVEHERLRATDRVLVGAARRAPRFSRWVAERASRTPSS